MIDQYAFRMTTPRDLEALDRGIPLAGPALEYPIAIQACSEEAEAAAIRGQATARTCRLVYVQGPGDPTA